MCIRPSASWPANLQSSSPSPLPLQAGVDSGPQPSQKAQPLAIQVPPTTAPGPRSVSPHSQTSQSALSPAPSSDRDSSGKPLAAIFPRRKAGQNDFKAKRGRPALVVDRAFIESLLHLPLSEAAEEVGVCVTSLKRMCRKVGVQRWPYVRRFPVGSGNSQQPSKQLKLAEDDLSAEDTAPGSPTIADANHLGSTSAPATVPIANSEEPSWDEVKSEDMSQQVQAPEFGHEFDCLSAEGTKFSGLDQHHPSSIEGLNDTLEYLLQARPINHEFLTAFLQEDGDLRS
eukprot:CAMPEP_0184294452 /NCGR_PEP_ID=MMETSP1049-20130417/5644_1 /TAXON_ID=77928 /ORGANISM="Proteomonas sulcata, Strain CCMP704" /LENGTH=284 /DNA_ID=CAMNT_0026602743 /DNA_START=55 /DNA_END=909 /DNA_ORIENTATION=+